jgi:hypothetical protein
MNNIESELQDLPITPAPDTLDRRVAQTLQAHTNPNHGIASVRIPLWGCAAACLAFFAIAIGISFRHAQTPRASAPPLPIMCSLVGGPAFSAVFAPESEPTEFFLRKKEQVIPHIKSEGTQL